MKRFALISVIAAVLLSLFAHAEVAENQTESESESETEEPYPAVLLLEGPDGIDGDEFILSVTADGKDLRGGRVKLSFDGTKTEVFSVEYPEETDMTVRYSEKENDVTFLFYNTEKTTGAVKIMDIVFKVNDGAEGDAITVDVDEAVFSDGVTETVPEAESYAATLTVSVHSDTETDSGEVTDTDTSETDTETTNEGSSETETDEETTKTEQTTEKPPVTDKETTAETTTETVTVTETETDTEMTETEPEETTAETATETETETETEPETTKPVPVIATETGTETDAPDTDYYVGKATKSLSSVICVIIVCAACSALSAGAGMLINKLKSRKM